jgi:hypothetical protein
MARHNILTTLKNDSTKTREANVTPLTAVKWTPWSRQNWGGFKL